MARIVFDRAKMKDLGGGSIKGFCEAYNIKRTNLYRIENTTRKTPGTYAQKITERLISIGVAKWVNDPQDRVPAA